MSEIRCPKCNHDKSHLHYKEVKCPDCFCNYRFNPFADKLIDKASAVSVPYRPSRDQYWLNLLTGVASRSTCPRRHTSAIIVDEDNHLLASGYNGSPRGVAHCTTHPCEGINDQSGDSSRCIAVHAEQNAILQAGDRLRFAAKMYTLTFPCFVCAKLICQTPIKHLVFVQDYEDPRSHSLFAKSSINVYQKEIENVGI